MTPGFFLTLFICTQANYNSETARCHVSYPPANFSTRATCEAEGFRLRAFLLTNTQAKVVRIDCFEGAA